MKIVGLFLLGGFFAFAVGALLPPARAFTGTHEERRRIVGEHPSRWVGSAVGLGVGVVLTLAGLALLSAELITERSWILSILALVSFGVGAVLFLFELAFRATVLVSVATAGDDVPDWFAPLQAWAGAAYWAYMPLAYLGLAATGGAILRGKLLAPWFGWAAAGFGLLGAVVYLTKRPRPLWAIFDIPGLLYILTGAIGVGFLAAK